MVFSNLNQANGLTALNDYLADKSYIEGYNASQADVSVFNAVGKAPEAKYQHAARWYRHIASYTNKDSLPGDKAKASALVVAAASGAAAAKTEAAAADDDIDLFGDDDEEDAEAAKLREARLAEYNAKKSNKPVLIAKSNIVLDVKPWDDETDMAELEKAVRSVECDGLLWGASKLVEIGYGIKKLQITCVVEDDKVGTDFLEEEIVKFEDLVQSVDVAAFNKI